MRRFCAGLRGTRGYGDGVSGSVGAQWQWQCRWQCRWRDLDADEGELSSQSDVVGDWDWVSAAEACAAEAFAADGALQALERQVAEAVGGDVLVHLATELCAAMSSSRVGVSMP